MKKFSEIDDLLAMQAKLAKVLKTFQHVYLLCSVERNQPFRCSFKLGTVIFKLYPFGNLGSFDISGDSSVKMNYLALVN